jgi:hypothetical protein
MKNRMIKEPIMFLTLFVVSGIRSQLTVIEIVSPGQTVGASDDPNKDLEAKAILWIQSGVLVG